MVRLMNPEGINMAAKDNDIHMATQEERIQKLRDVLEFYSNELNYQPQDYKGMHNLPPISGDYAPLSDDGKRARQALKDDK